MDFDAQLEKIKDDFRNSKRILTAMGDETRQAIMLALFNASCEGMRVGEITKQTHLSRPTVSHHLKILREAGLVEVWHEGTMNFYTGNLGEEFQHLYNLVCHLEELRRAFDESEDNQCVHEAKGEL